MSWTNDTKQLNLRWADGTDSGYVLRDFSKPGEEMSLWIDLEKKKETFKVVKIVDTEKFEEERFYHNIWNLIRSR